MEIYSLEIKHFHHRIKTRLFKSYYFISSFSTSAHNNQCRLIYIYIFHPRLRQIYLLKRNHFFSDNFKHYDSYFKAPVLIWFVLRRELRKTNPDQLEVLSYVTANSIHISERRIFTNSFPTRPRSLS